MLKATTGAVKDQARKCPFAFWPWMFRLCWLCEKTPFPDAAANRNCTVNSFRRHLADRHVA